MKILAIETSCDESAISLMETKSQGGAGFSKRKKNLKIPQFKILENLVASQIKVHQPFGGVVPNLAKREHLKNLPILLEKIKENKIKNIDLIAVTVGPGLEPALWTGVNFAQQLAKKIKKPLLGVSHLDGHLYSFLLSAKNRRLRNEDLFPAIGLIASGGHTILIKVDSLVKYKKLGETVDDAVGEAFDKVARILGLSYPGGPEIEKLAKKGNPNSILFPRPMLKQKNYNFSYSGLKTSVLYYLRDHQNEQKSDIAASFQKAAFDVLIKKTLRAAEEFKAKSIMISGGVAANKTLAQEFKKAINEKFKAHNLRTKKPQLLITKFPTDNAAMIAIAAYINHIRKKKYKLEANGNLDI